MASGQPYRSRALEDYMNWDALSAIGQTVGALAVVISLIYLAVQMRQNTRAVRGTSFQAVTDAFTVTSST